MFLQAIPYATGCIRYIFSGSVQIDFQCFSNKAMQWENYQYQATIKHNTICTKLFQRYQKYLTTGLFVQHLVPPHNKEKTHQWLPHKDDKCGKSFLVMTSLYHNPPDVMGMTDHHVYLIYTYINFSRSNHAEFTVNADQVQSTVLLWVHYGLCPDFLIMHVYVFRATPIPVLYSESGSSRWQWHI